MKAIFTLLLSATILIGANSCVLYVNPKHDNGKHKGWYKHPRNPGNQGNPEHHEEHHDKGGHGEGKKKGK